LLAGKRIDMPPVRQTSMTHKRALKAKGKTAQPKALDFHAGEEPPF
jgi:hypothetical protein